MPRETREGMVDVMEPISGAAVIILIFGGRARPEGEMEGLRFEAL